MKLTRQGVRDLNSLPSTPRGRKADPLPREPVRHTHTAIYTRDGRRICLGCGRETPPEEEDRVFDYRW